MRLFVIYMKKALTSYRIYILFLILSWIYLNPKPPQNPIPQTAIVYNNSRVVDAFRHCWNGYKEFAWGFDELHPVSKTGSNWFGLGLTIIDTLDTAFLTSQMDIFEQASNWVSNSLSFQRGGESNVFEITIRVLGGLLSSYHLTSNVMFKDKAVELADLLLVCFDTKHGIPISSISMIDKRCIPSTGGASTAEATTVQMEFKYLTYITGDPKYWNAVQKTMAAVFAQNAKNGLVPIYINVEDGSFWTDVIRLGSRGDSYYGT